MNNITSTSSGAARRLLRNLLFSQTRTPTPRYLDSNITNPLRLPLRPKTDTHASVQQQHRVISSATRAYQTPQNDTTTTATATIPKEGELATLTLPTGRDITYRCYGPPTGKPMFYFHGTPSSAVESAALIPFIRSRNILVIGPSRPGFGKSDLQPGRTLLDYAHDVTAIADSLGIDKFRVMGASGGGPYALACAKVIPKERMTGAAVVAGVAPWHLGREGMDYQGWIRFMVARYLTPMIPDFMLRRFDAKMNGMSTEELSGQFEKELRMVSKSLGEKDKAAMAREDVMKDIVDSFIEAYERGVDGAVEDTKLLLGDWGFRLEDMPCEGIKLYYGTEDRATPVYAARKMQKILKGATLTEFEGDGHWSILLNRGDEIFDDFMGEA